MIERSRVQIPTGAAREFSSRVSTFYDSYFGIRSTPRVTTVARKRPRSFSQNCRWQVTDKYACIIHMWLFMKWHGVWLYGVHRTHWDGSSFMCHQPCQRCKYTTSVDIQKTLYKKLVTHVEPHASAVSLLKRAENSAISAIINQSISY